MASREKKEIEYDLLDAAKAEDPAQCQALLAILDGLERGKERPEGDQEPEPLRGQDSRALAPGQDEFSDENQEPLDADQEK